MKTTKKWRDELRRYIAMRSISGNILVNAEQMGWLLDDADELESLQECFHCGGDVTICKAKCEG